MVDRLVVLLSRVSVEHGARVHTLLSTAVDMVVSTCSDASALNTRGTPRVLVVVEETRDACIATLLLAHPQAPQALAVAIPAVASAEDTLALLRAGFAQVVVPPLRPVDLLPHVWRHLDTVSPGAPLRERVIMASLIGHSPAFVKALERLERVARAEAPALLTGETGTGKELFARALHHLGTRAARMFVPVNCGAIPAELAENELFGHVRGAYTHALTDKPGLVHEARGGTLFLDEVDSLSLPLQAKLLRFLQIGEYRRVGSTELCFADVRVVSATNADPERAVAEGRLRRDLYYRLCTLSLELPPLRARRGDIELLARHFLARHRGACATPLALDPGAIAALEAHDWPGNVRELEQVMLRASIWATGPTITADLLELPEGTPVAVGGEAKVEGFNVAKRRAVSSFERLYIEDILGRTGGNISRAADLSGQDRRVLFRLIRKHHIDVERFRA